MLLSYQQVLVNMIQEHRNMLFFVYYESYHQKHIYTLQMYVCDV